MNFTFKNIRIKIGFSFFAMLAVLLCFNFNYIILYSILFAILHEIGHLVFIFIGGEKPSAITFSAFGMAIKRGNDVKLNYKMEIISALGGPFVNILLFIILLIYYCTNNNEKILVLASINIILGCFNLLPIFSLDGGRVLENYLLLHHSPQNAEKVINTVSIITLIPLSFLGFYILISSGYNFTLLLICIYLSVAVYMKTR